MKYALIAVLVLAGAAALNKAAEQAAYDALHFETCLRIGC